MGSLKFVHIIIIYFLNLNFIRNFFFSKIFGDLRSHKFMSNRHCWAPTYPLSLFIFIFLNFMLYKTIKYFLLKVFDGDQSRGITSTTNDIWMITYPIKQVKKRVFWKTNVSFNKIQYLVRLLNILKIWVHSLINYHY